LSDPSNKLLLFGGGGAIGNAVRTAFVERGWQVVATGRKGTDGLFAYDPFASSADNQSALERGGPFDAVCWAQGANLNDSVRTVESDAHLEVYRANVLFCLVSLRMLLERKLLTSGARLCVISSIWQTIARPNKLSYSITKAALQGFVTAASVDLGHEGILINAVLPGPLDTPMTRTNLTVEQIASLTKATGFGRLAKLEDVATLVRFLCSRDNKSITGQFVRVDVGLSHARLV
jgi:NAD(P)-dependent dehydrogenase (short-subunit alcohol dehydrogenase family)